MLQLLHQPAHLDVLKSSLKVSGGENRTFFEENCQYFGSLFNSGWRRCVDIELDCFFFFPFFKIYKLIYSYTTFIHVSH